MTVCWVRHMLTGFLLVLSAELCKWHQRFTRLLSWTARLGVWQMCLVFPPLQLFIWLVAVGFNTRWWSCGVAAVPVSSQLVARFEINGNVKWFWVDTWKPRVGSDAASLSRTRCWFRLKSKFKLNFHTANQKQEIKFTSELWSHDDVFPQHGTHAGIWHHVTVALDTCCCHGFSPNRIDGLTLGSWQIRISTEIKRFRTLMGELLLEFHIRKKLWDNER